MRIAVIIIAMTVLAACNHASKPRAVVVKPVKKPVPETKVDTPEQIPEVHYSEKELIAFMDSVGRLPTNEVIYRNSRFVDSAGNSLTTSLNRQFSEREFNLLKKAVKDTSMKYSTAEKLFGKLTVDRSCNSTSLFDSVAKGSLYIQYFPFGRDKNAFDYFAIGMGDLHHCEGAQLFYFKGHKLIACQNGFIRWNDDLKHFIAPDGQPVFIKVIEFENGSGIWWFQWVFFKYDGDRLVKVLDELENGNLQPGWASTKSQWLDATILKTDPFKIKMVYYHRFYKADGDSGFKEGPYVVNDSTIVRYLWADDYKSLAGQFEGTGITREQTLSYNLFDFWDSNLIFIKTYYKTLDEMLHNKNRSWVLQYLSEVKNYRYQEKIRAAKKKHK